MPLPGSVTTVTVTEDYRRADGTAPTGRVTFTPSVRSVVAGTSIVIEPVTVKLTNGQLSVVLAWQDDPDLSPIGWTYTVVESIGQQPSRQWSVRLPSTGPVTLHTLAPVDPVVPTVVRVLSVNGELPDATGNIEVGAGAAPVQSVDGRTGSVVLGDLYIDPAELASGLAGKADTSHTHAQVDVTGLSAALTGKETAGAAAAAVAAHEAAGDPHPQYLTAAEGNAAYDPLNAATSAIAAHTAAGDPHPQYLTAAEGNTAYAALTHGHAIGDVTSLQGVLDGKASKPVVRQAYVTSGNIQLNTGTNTWGPLTASPTLVIPAVVGDYIALDVTVLRQANANIFLDVGVLVSAAIVRYMATGSGTPAGEGDPGLYHTALPARSGSRGFTVVSGDLSGGNVTFTFAIRNTSGASSLLLASTDNPLYWVAKNHGPVS